MSVDVSIIIPVYNDCNIKRILQSALNQTGDVRFEVIVIDDGSTDDTVKIIDEYCAIDDRFSVIRQENQGVSVARNKGIEAAKGEYLVFWDSDDEAPEDAIVSLYKAVSSESADMAVGKMIVDDCGDRYVQSSVRHLSGLKYISKYDVEFCTNFVLMNKIFRKKIILDNNVRFKLYEVESDGAFLYDYLARAEKIVGCDHQVYCYVVRPSWENRSISQRTDKESLFGRAKSLNHIYDSIENNFADCSDKTVLLSKIANRAVHTSFIGLFYGNIWNAYPEAETDMNELISKWEDRISRSDWEAIDNQFGLYVRRHRVIHRMELSEIPFFSFAVEPRVNQEEIVTIIEGIYAQKFPAFELLIDENFRSRYPEKCNKANMEFISIDSSNRLEEFRNKALAKARGKYINFIDEVILPNRLTIKRLYKQLIKRDADMVTCLIKSTVYNNSALVLYRILSNDRYQKLDSHEQALIFKASSILGNRLIKTEVLRDRGLTFSGDTSKDVTTVCENVGEVFFAKNVSFISSITDKYLMDKMNMPRGEREYIIDINSKIERVISLPDLLDLLRSVNISWGIKSLMKLVENTWNMCSVQVEDLEEKNKRLERQLQKIKSSKSYKVGRIVTYPARLLKRF